MSHDYSISAAIDKAARRLAEAGVADPRRQAGSLLSFVLGRDRAYLIMNAARSLSTTEAQQFEHLVDRRALREPFQHITGHQEFYGLDFLVTPEVLIPRPETELLVERALALLSPGDTAARICDVGVGSGCIIVTLLHERPDLQGLGLDISPAALAVAANNALRLRISDRLELRNSDGFETLKGNAERFLLITANPPYVTESDFAGLEPEVRDHEPRLALTPGGDGLSLIRRLLAEAPPFLVPGGHLLMEIGYDQGDAVAAMIDRSIWSEFGILPDLQGIPRCVVLQRA